MPLPTEPIGSIPRPPDLVDGLRAFQAGRLSEAHLHALYDAAVRDTIARFEATGSPVITDGEQTKPSFATYAIDGLANLAPDGVVIRFADGHTRQLPRLTAGPRGSWSLVLGSWSVLGAWSLVRECVDRRTKNQGRSTDQEPRTKN